MSRLILLRHAKAESVAASGGDIERGLTERGRRDAAIIGRVLAQAGFTPDRVLVSTARRAQETWDEMQASFPEAEVESRRNLYLASCEMLASTAQAAPAGCVMIIGHNPSLHEYAEELIGRGRGGALDGFPTAAAVVFDQTAAGQYQLNRLFTPRDHGGGAL